MNTSNHHWAKKSNSVVHNWQRRDCWALFLKKEWRKSCGCEFITLHWRKFIPAVQRRRNIDIHTVVFQQDGTPPHCSNRTFQYLRQHFLGGRLLSRRTDNPWPPYSPDLNPADYNLWGYFKERVYTGNPRSSEELKESIRQEIRIPAEMLTRVVENFNVCLAAVI